MPWPQTGATQYHTQLGLSDKSRAINGFCQGSRAFELANSLALDCYQTSPEVLIVLRY